MGLDLDERQLIHQEIVGTGAGIVDGYLAGATKLKPLDSGRGGRLQGVARWQTDPALAMGGAVLRPVRLEHPVGGSGARNREEVAKKVATKSARIAHELPSGDAPP